MKAYELAKILLQGENFPVVIPTLANGNQATFIQNVDLYQNADSPFEYCLLLTSKGTQFLDDEIEVPD